MKLVEITLVFLLLPYYSKTSMSVHTALNQEQINSISDAHLKYQELIAYAKEKNLDLNSVLSKEEKKLMQQGVDFLREFLPKIKGAAKGQLVGLEEIPRKTFAEELSDWFFDEIDKLKVLKSNTSIINTDIYLNSLKSSLERNNLTKLIYNNLGDVIGQKNNNECGVIASNLISTLKTFNIKYCSELFKNHPEIRKELRGVKSIINRLPNSGLLAEDLKNAISENAKEQNEKTIRTWLQGEKSNLEKMQFAEGMMLDCDSFKLSLANYMGSDVQQLLTANIDSDFINVNQACGIIQSNIDHLLSSKDFSEILLSKYELIQIINNNDAVISSFKGNFKVNSEFLGNLLEHGFKLTSEIIADITKEDSADSYIDVHTLRLKSSPFCKDNLLKTSEKTMELSAFSKMIEECKTNCLKNPSNYNKYIEGNAYFGIDSFAQSIKRNHHKLSLRELALEYRDNIDLPDSLSGKYKLDKLIENLADCYLLDVGGFDILSKIFVPIWANQLQGAETDSEGYIKGSKLLKLLHSITGTSYEDIEKELNKLVDKKIKSDIENLMNIRKDWPDALPNAKDLKIAIDNSKFRINRPALGPKDSLKCVMQFDDGTEKITGKFNLAVKPYYNGRYPILKLLEVVQEGGLVHNVSYGNIKLEGIKLGAESYDAKYVYNREIIFNFIYHKETSLTHTDASENTSTANSLGGSVQGEIPIPRIPVKVTGTYSHTWSTIKVGPKFTKGNKMIQEYAVEVKAKYTASLWQTNMNKIEETFNTLISTEEKQLSFDLVNSIKHGLTIEQINNIRLE